MNREYITALLKKNRCGALIKLSINNVHNWSHDDYLFLYKGSLFYNNLTFRIYIENNVILKKFRSVYQDTYERVYNVFNRNFGIDYVRNFFQKHNFNVSKHRILCYDLHNINAHGGYNKDLIKYMLDLFEYGIINDNEFEQSIDDIFISHIHNYYHIYQYMYLLTSKKFYMLSNNVNKKFNNQYRIFLTNFYKNDNNKKLNIVCDILNMDSDIIDVVVYDTLIRYIMKVNIIKKFNIPHILKHYIENTNMKAYSELPIVKKIVDHAT